MSEVTPHSYRPAPARIGLCRLIAALLRIGVLAFALAANTFAQGAQQLGPWRWDDVDRVVVATDDSRIQDVATGFGAEVCDCPLAPVKGTSGLPG